MHVGTGQVEQLGDERDGAGVDVAELLLQRVQDRKDGAAQVDVGEDHLGGPLGGPLGSRADPGRAGHALLLRRLRGGSHRGGDVMTTLSDDVSHLRS